MKDIGGYIELDIKKISEPYHKGALEINNARNGIVYAIRAYNIKELWVPYYTCPVVWQAIEIADCKLRFYNINEALMPAQDFEKDDYILYTNYFGVCNKNIELLTKKYRNLIIDNAQAFYASPSGIASVYSPRKFFGVSDGGYLYCSKELNQKFIQDKDSYKRFSHLLMRIEGGSDFGYCEFNKNEDTLENEEIKLMSNLTSELLKGVNYDEAKNVRLNNYYFLNEKLEHSNKIKIKITDDVPMYYPYLTENDKLRENLIKNRIFIPACWRGIEDKCLKNSYELYLKKYMFLLIIDQRYGKEEMKKILEVINAS